jgi:hypothetical protein
MKNMTLFFLATIVLPMSIAAQTTTTPTVVAPSTITLKAIELKDQFDTTTSTTTQLQWLIFSDDKEVSNIVNKALDELKITDIAGLKGLYVSDISKMPGFVTKMFAIPKMKKYAFKVVLDREGKVTADWPKEKGKATLLELDQLQIKSSQFSNKVEEIKAFLEKQKALVGKNP